MTSETVDLAKFLDPIKAGHGSYCAHDDDGKNWVVVRIMSGSLSYALQPCLSSYFDVYFEPCVAKIRNNQPVINPVTKEPVYKPVIPGYAFVKFNDKAYSATCPRSFKVMRMANSEEPSIVRFDQVLRLRDLLMASIAPSVKKEKSKPIREYNIGDFITVANISGKIVGVDSDSLSVNLTNPIFGLKTATVDLRGLI